MPRTPRRTWLVPVLSAAALLLLLALPASARAQDAGEDGEGDWLGRTPPGGVGASREEVLLYLRGLEPDALAALLAELAPAGGGDASAGEARLQGALEALADGRLDEARLALQRFARDNPADPRAALASRLADSVASLQAEQGRGKTIRPGGVSGELVERDTGSTAAAIELVTTLTVYGIWSGVALGLALEIEDEYFVLASALTGLGALGGALWYAWDRPIDGAQSSLVTNGLLFGTWNGLAIALMAEADDDGALWGITWGGSTVGIAAGLVLGATVDDIDDGDVALASSGGLWGTFLAGMMLLIAQPDDLDTTAVFGALLAGTDLGLAAMGVASMWIDTSRGRQTLIDLGGLLAAMLGGGILVAAESDDATVIGLTMLASAGAGITITALLTSLLDDDDDDPAAAALEPAPPVQLALPAPLLIPTADPDHPAAGIGLLQGTW